ncbi:MAG: ABC transporter permease, partial [Anaerolineae bacterium]
METTAFESRSQAAEPARRSGPRYFMRQLLRHRSAQIGGTVVLLLVFFAFFAPYVVPYDPFDVQTDIRLTPPNLQHPFGTDELGRDLFSRILYGARYTLM